MELPSWFQNVIQQRLDQIGVLIQRHPELRKSRAEEGKAFDALFAGVNKMQLPGFAEWEDKHHSHQALANERLYLQGVRDGAQLIFALLTDSALSGVKGNGNY